VITCTPWTCRENARRTNPTQCTTCKIRREEKQRQRLKWIVDINSVGLVVTKGAMNLTNDRWRSFIRIQLSITVRIDDDDDDDDNDDDDIFSH